MDRVIVTVPAEPGMSHDIFIKHMNHRHLGSIQNIKGGLPDGINKTIEDLYRRFHAQLHATRIDLDHIHEEPHA